jgi:guanylate kinase
VNINIISEDEFKTKIKNKEITEIESKGRYEFDLTLHVFKIKLEGKKVILHVEMI